MDGRGVQGMEMILRLGLKGVAGVSRDPSVEEMGTRESRGELESELSMFAGLPAKKDTTWFQVLEIGGQVGQKR